VVAEAKGNSFGRCRLQVVPKIDAEHFGQFLHQYIEPGAVVISDALRSYPPTIADTFGPKPFNVKRSGLHAHELLPGVHRVASLLKRCQRRPPWECEESTPSTFHRPEDRRCAPRRRPAITRLWAGQGSRCRST